MSLWFETLQGISWQLQKVHHALVSPTYWHKEVLSPRFKKKHRVKTADICTFPSSRFHLKQMNNVLKSVLVVVIVHYTVHTVPYPIKWYMKDLILRKK